jgi:Dolichol-phosphate mannosyltransferase subunit 3 (DPM3)
LSRLVVGLAVWHTTLHSKAFLAQYSGNEDNHNTSAPIPVVLITYAPIWTILCLGIYAVTSIGLGVRNVRDVPEAAVELEQQISEARKEMKTRGIIMVDSDHSKPHVAGGQPVSADTKKST